MPALAAVSLIVDGTGHHFVYRCAAAEPSAFGNVLIRDMARVLRRDFANDIDALVTHVRERYSAPAAAKDKTTAARRRTLSFRALIDRAVPTKRVIADWQYVIDCDERYFYIMDRNHYLLEAVTRGLTFTLDDDRFPDPDLLVPEHQATEPPPADETFDEPPRWIKTPEWQTVTVPPADEVRRMFGYRVPETTETIAVAISDGTDHAFIPVTRYMTWDNIMTRARHALYQMPAFSHRVLERYNVRACLFSATPRLAHQGAGARVLDVMDPTPGAPFEALVPGAVLYASVVYLVDHGVWWTPFGRAGPYCAHCGSCAGPELRLKTCSVCRGPYYCSVDCQRAHWREGGHKSVCIKKA